MALNMQYVVKKIKVPNPAFDPTKPVDQVNNPRNIEVDGAVATSTSIRKWGEDKLGLTLNSKILEAKNLAIGNPKKYMEDRTKAIEAANVRVGETFEKTYQAYLNQGIGDDASRKYALDVAKAVRDNEYNLINLKYPDAYTATAETKQSAINSLKAAF